MIKLRPLKLQDAPLILEWMHDTELASNFRQDFSQFDLASQEEFIKNVQNTPDDLHFAIVDDADDEYLGSISLKKIDRVNKNAEYAVAMRRTALGTGAAAVGTTELLKIAFEREGLEKVYLNVLSDNKRAQSFYEKLGFAREGESTHSVLINGEFKDLVWYSILHEQFINQHSVVKWKLLEFNELGDERGHLVVAESKKDIPFLIKRVFYIYGSDSTVVRGQHANRRTQFVLINVNGRSKVRIDDGQTKTVIELNQPHQAVYLNRMIWKDMYDFSPDSVLLVLASEPYDADEYIRDYQQYLAEVNSHA
jgi:RimJ/RimL family protein N-acetyltransferase